jgi:hypothetical protein
MTAPMVELNDRWSVSFEEADLYSCGFDFAVSLQVRDQSDSWVLRIEQIIALVSNDGHEQIVEPEGEIRQLYPILHYLRRAVASISAFKDGSLEVVMSDGDRIRVSADSDFEAWELAGPSGVRIVSMPGGELAVWRPSS